MAFFLAAAAGVSRGVEAHGDHVEILAGGERQRLRPRPGRSAPGCRASGSRSRPARAPPAACRSMAEGNARPALVAEGGVERDLLVELLLDAHLLQQGGRVAAAGASAAGFCAWPEPSPPPSMRPAAGWRRIAIELSRSLLFLWGLFLQRFCGGGGGGAGHAGRPCSATKPSPARWGCA